MPTSAPARIASAAPVASSKQLPTNGSRGSAGRNDSTSSRAPHRDSASPVISPVITPLAASGVPGDGGGGGRPAGTSSSSAPQNDAADASETPRARAPGEPTAASCVDDAPSANAVPAVGGRLAAKAPPQATRKTRRVFATTSSAVASTRSPPGVALLPLSTTLRFFATGSSESPSSDDAPFLSDSDDAVTAGASSWLPPRADDDRGGAPLDGASSSEEPWARRWCACRCWAGLASPPSVASS
mmetsp:Transcript_5236/g.21585  ORF Transcript_5236/g.21585 Transcript_5236/m.21585 type:complete len:243 (+) Transcript_5236:1623-2351(+)